MHRTGLHFQPGGDNASSPFCSVATRLLADIGCIGLRRQMSPDGTISYPWFSEALGNLLGFRPDQMTVNAKGALNSIHWADRDDHLRMILDSAARLEPCRESFRIIDAHGQTRWLKGTCYPRRLDDGRVIWDGVWMDETQHQRAEDQHQTLIDSAQDCILTTDAGGIITWGNAAAAACFALTLDQLTGKSASDLFHVPDLKPGTHEVSASRTDGREFPFQMTLSEFRRDGVLNLIIIGRDITEANRIQQERRQLELLLMESQKLEALGRLAGGISHELNNMLGPILMGAEMIARTASLDPRNAERVRRIIEAAKNSRDIVRNILAYCRKESRTLVPVEMVALLHDFLGLAQSVVGSSTRIEWKCGIGRAMILGDEGQIRQILLNLVNNARDAMTGEGTLTFALGIPDRSEIAAFQARLGDIDPDRSYLQLRIEDTGPGIPPGLIGKVFEPFFTSKPVGQGTGLGLSVVQGIVKAMNGAITVDSTPGRGCTFHILLPLVGE